MAQRGERNEGNRLQPLPPPCSPYDRAMSGAVAFVIALRSRNLSNMDDRLRKIARSSSLTSSKALRKMRFCQDGGETVSQRYSSGSAGAHAGRAS